MKYNQETLDKYLDNYNAKFIECKNNLLKRDSTIIYSCNCGEICQKTFRQIITAVLLCNRCKFIVEANLKHNDIYNYDKADFITGKIKVTITCKIHGDFMQTPKAHKEGQGCPKCGFDKISTGKIKSIDNFINDANLVHHNKYDYSKSIYIHNNKNVIITCKIHGDFLQTPSNHLSKKGCPKCSKVYRKNTEEYIQEVIKIHGDKYDYSEVEYTQAHAKIKIICKIHGIFEQAASSHLHTKTGCPKCKLPLYSKMSIDWLNYKNISNNIIHAENEGEFRIIGTPYHADGYCKETNTVYEFLGDWFHGNSKKFKHTDIHPLLKVTYGDLYNKTQKRKETIISLGYNYIEIWEYDWKNAIKNLKKFQRKFKIKYLLKNS